jgi:hypothetical protein
MRAAARRVHKCEFRRLSGWTQLDMDRASTAAHGARRDGVRDKYPQVVPEVNKERRFRRLRGAYRNVADRYLRRASRRGLRGRGTRVRYRQRRIPELQAHSSVRYRDGEPRIIVCIVVASPRRSAQWSIFLRRRLGKESLPSTGRFALAASSNERQASLLPFVVVSARSWIAPVLSTRLAALQPPSLPPSVYSLTSRRLYSVHTSSTPRPSTTLTLSPPRLLQSAAPQPVARRACLPNRIPRLFCRRRPYTHTPPILIVLSARTYHDPADTASLRRPTTSSRSRLVAARRHHISQSRTPTANRARI